jgi:hypothetical protein
MPDDEKLAHAMRDRFGAAGHEVFIDVGMKVGTDWVAEIAQRITWCDFLIVLLSKSAVESEMVQAEVRLAYQRRRRDGRPAILPVRVNYKGALDYELDAYLGRIQYIMWTGDGDTGPVINELQKRFAEVDPTSRTSAPSLDELDLTSPGEQLRDRRRPQASEDPRVLLPPGGTLPPARLPASNSRSLISNHSRRRTFPLFQRSPGESPRYCSAHSD